MRVLNYVDERSCSIPTATYMMRRLQLGNPASQMCGLQHAKRVLIDTTYLRWCNIYMARGGRVDRWQSMECNESEISDVEYPI